MINIAKFIDMTGQKIGKWTVLDQADPRKDSRGYNVIYWRCLCDCGTIREVSGNTLRSGKSMSCGCNQTGRINHNKSRFKTHGKSKTRLYKIWAGIKKRCNNPKSYNFKNYGERGILMCDEWNEYVVFEKWALSNGYNDNLSIDRIDVNSNYCPENCRWVDGVAQANNRRTSRYLVYNNESHTISEWARLLNVKYKNLHKYIQKGKTLEEYIKTHNIDSQTKQSLRGFSHRSYGRSYEQYGLHQ